jgi:hypothetical protein
MQVGCIVRPPQIAAPDSSIACLRGAVFRQPNAKQGYYKLPPLWHLYFYSGVSAAIDYARPAYDAAI